MQKQETGLPHYQPLTIAGKQGAMQKGNRFLVEEQLKGRKGAVSFRGSGTPPNNAALSIVTYEVTHHIHR